MSFVDISYCVLLLSGAFALVSLGFLFIQTSTSLKQATVLMKMLETTITKVNAVLDDVSNKLDMLNAPVDLVSGIFSRGSMKAGLFSWVGLFSSLFKRKSKRGE